MATPPAEDLRRFGFWNMENLGWIDSPAESERAQLGYRVIAEQIRPDVFAIAELRPGGDDPERGAERQLRELAEATGMECEYAPGKAAVSLGFHTFAVGLCWRPGITPVPDSWAVTGPDIWHRAAALHLDVGGTVIKHAVYHAPPFGQHRRADEAERIVAFMSRPPSRPAGFIAGDWNGLSGDRIREPGYESYNGFGELEDIVPDKWVHYDPDTLARPTKWHPDFVHQCEWTYDHDGHRDRWRSNRRPGEILWEGGLADAAAQLEAPWKQTTGHRSAEQGDPYGPRRIDAIKATPDAVPMLHSYEVIGGQDPETVSDHLPIAITYQPGRTAVTSDREETTAQSPT
ncbi:endonuclease/exonuclease/phosphatase family metal-dependent hydrolase [Nocardia sp. GAS34]|uniref:endonuclease/exonuclease/phosphatase family protein n=1 Tax=unclassified Nocardia TaxID=2637762 RepID=UPI003D2306B9